MPASHALPNVTAMDVPLDDIVRVDTSPLLPDTFVGAGGDYPPLGLYGGHLLGQALAAAFATVSPDKTAHALHGHFLRAGAPSTPITYQVERLRDGRNYVTRLIRAAQAGQLLMIMSASFKAAEPGDQHQPQMAAVPAPEALAAERARAGTARPDLPFAGIGGVEIEPVGGWHPGDAPGGPPGIAMWTRCALSAGADARARQCALAYLSDGTMMFNALRPHGTLFRSHRSTSLDHAVWFHRDADPVRWLLFDQTGPVAGDGRGLNQGRIFTGDGQLVASVAQEAMMRRSAEDAAAGGSGV